MKIKRKIKCLVIVFLNATTLLVADSNFSSLTSGLVAHYSFNQSLSELSSGGAAHLSTIM